MEQNAKLRIGILGGTFNPIHIGHLILAESAYELFHLDKVMIMPSCNPPHKEVHSLVSAKQRMKMTELAIRGNHHLELSSMEMDRQGITYTFETLQQLKALQPDTEYYFIMGADSLFSFDTWKHPEIICQCSILLAAAREDMDRKKLQKQIEILTKQYNAKICILDSPRINISSQEIRKRVLEKKSIKYFVNSDVECYIYKNHLYDKNEV